MRNSAKGYSDILVAQRFTQSHRVRSSVGILSYLTSWLNMIDEESQVESELEKEPVTVSVK